MADQPDHLATVRAALDLAAKATPGPWRPGTRGLDDPAYAAPNEVVARVEGRNDGRECHLARFSPAFNCEENAAAIVAIRNAAPAIADLCREVEAGRDRIAKLEAELARARSTLKEASDLFIAIQATDGEEEHRAICDGAALAAKIDAATGATE